jgi:hypothetical protein
MSAAGRDTPFGADFSATIAQMKALVAQSADRELLGEGPPHPDAALLDICAEIGHQRKVAEAAFRHRLSLPPAHWMSKTPAEALQITTAQMDDKAAEKKYGHLLRNAAKLKATTPAGIYAKAIAVRSSKTGARFLAVSMAEDLLACTALRASLWPAGEGE